MTQKQNLWHPLGCIKSDGGWIDKQRKATFPNVVRVHQCQDCNVGFHHSSKTFSLHFLIQRTFKSLIFRPKHERWIDMPDILWLYYKSTETILPCERELCFTITLRSEVYLLCKNVHTTPNKLMGEKPWKCSLSLKEVWHIPMGRSNTF